MTKPTMNENSPLIVEVDGDAASLPKIDESHEPAVKEIGHIGSFTLLINNMTGPAMLGFPRLFQQAGLIPTTCTVLFIYLCATLSGTLFSDAISAIPGNKTFDRHVDFSSAFRLVIGKEFYIVAETLFLITCAVQAIAAIVEAAQSVDGFLASFLIGRTYALQVSPNIALIEWTPELCIQDELHMNDGEVPSTEGEDCTPFNGAGGFIITLGFLLTTMLFLPLGRGHLKETIIVQILAFSFMTLLLLQFSGEFIMKGLPHSIPLFGGTYSQLAGVVLFNYAYIVTVPSWLIEKKNEVSVNHTIWHASTLSSVIYLGFGIMCAMSFSDLGGNALIMLTSMKVHLFTRICAALFGVTIIGSGVPVFCVMIRTAIFHSGAVSYEWSLFFGSVAPYLIGWTLYQGTTLMSVVNWTGLVINGFVAFLLPMYLVIKSMEKRHLDVLVSHDTEAQEDQVLLEMNRPTARSTGTSIGSDLADQVTSMRYSTFESGLGGNGSNGSNMNSTSVTPSSLSGNNTATPSPVPVNVHEPVHEHPIHDDSCVEPLPLWLEPYRYPIVLFMIVCFAVIIGGTITLDVVMGIQPS